MAVAGGGRQVGKQVGRAAPISSTSRLLHFDASPPLPHARPPARRLKEKEKAQKPSHRRKTSMCVCLCVCSSMDLIFRSHAAAILRRKEDSRGDKD